MGRIIGRRYIINNINKMNVLLEEYMSFIIECKKCKSKNEFGKDFKNISRKHTIEITATRDHRIVIKCVQCGNEVESE